jgi:hypothetical protein
VTDELLRSAIELAFVVALAASKQRPALPVPTGLRPFLKLQRLPDRALGPIRKSLEADSDFRALVGRAATDDIVDAIGLLWLRRPDGWEGNASTLIAAEHSARDELDERRQARQAVKRLEATEQALRRSVVAEQAATHALDRARTELDAERSARRAAEESAATSSSAALQLRKQVEGARAEERTLRQRNDALEREMAELTERATHQQAHEVDNVAVAELSELARHLADRLSDVAARSRNHEHHGHRIDHTTQPRGPAPGRAKRASRVMGPGGRRALVVPAGLSAASREAAEHLLRQPGVVLVVDGYNLAKREWSDVELPDQRQRAIDLVAGVAARMGCAATVVFDGAAVVGPRSSRRGVRVVYSPADVSADDLIVTELQSGQFPAVVVTDDEELVGRVSTLGANRLPVATLVGLARRG